MICRGAVLAGERLWASPRAKDTPTVPSRCNDRAVAWSARRLVLAVVVLAALLALLPGRRTIPPVIESDYCYLFTAVDRAWHGHDFTAPQPAAPFQSWEWRSDWEFLTRWPVGYPSLLYAIRSVWNCSTIDAARGLSVTATALALVGWFVWLRTNLPRGLSGILVAGVGALSCISVSRFINPSTDLLITAAIPYLLMGVQILTYTNGPRPRPLWNFFALGIACGGLFWIRYASVFVPAAVAAYLLFRARKRNDVDRRRPIWFCAGSTTPIAALLILNALLGADASAQSQLNLGNRFSFSLEPQDLWRSWWTYTDLGFYSHHHWVHWFFALLPLASLIFSRIRRHSSTEPHDATHAGCALSALVMCALFAMLLLSTALFRGKFDYLALERYYEPIRPLYFLIFVGPILRVGIPLARPLCCLAMLLAANWTIAHEWLADYRRAMGATQLATPYGCRSGCFEPYANSIFEFIQKSARADVLVMSNFSEWITMETGVAAAPIPTDSTTLARWLERARQLRKTDAVTPMFVLDSDPKWRGYWIPSTPEVIRRFNLVPLTTSSGIVLDRVYRVNE